MMACRHAGVVKTVTSGAVVDLVSVEAHCLRDTLELGGTPYDGLPHRLPHPFSGPAPWSVVTLVLGMLLGGTALAVAGTDKKSDEYGEMGASPIPVVSAVSGPTSFRVSSFNILG